MDAVVARQLAEVVGSLELLTLVIVLGVTLVTADGIGVGFCVGQEFAQLVAQAWDGEVVERDAVRPRTGGSREVGG